VSNAKAGPTSEKIPKTVAVIVLEKTSRLSARIVLEILPLCVTTTWSRSPSWGSNWGNVSVRVQSVI
jgi:hypothetical protein